eukprot:403353875
MQRRLKHKSYNARNPYNIHSYMNQEILFQQDKDITTEQPFQQTQNDRSNSLNTANTLYGNPKYQYLLSKMKKKQYQTDRKIMNEDNFQVQKEGFQLQGQKAKLIDNSLFQLMGQYNQEQNTFKNSQTQEDYTISETETPMENKYQTKIFVKETKLQDSFELLPCFYLLKSQQQHEGCWIYDQWRRYQINRIEIQFEFYHIQQPKLAFKEWLYYDALITQIGSFKLIGQQPFSNDKQNAQQFALQQQQQWDSLVRQGYLKLYCPKL